MQGVAHGSFRTFHHKIYVTGRKAGVPDQMEQGQHAAGLAGQVLQHDVGGQVLVRVMGAATAAHDPAFMIERQGMVLFHHIRDLRGRMALFQPSQLFRPQHGIPGKTLGDPGGKAFFQPDEVEDVTDVHEPEQLVLGHDLAELSEAGRLAGMFRPGTGRCLQLIDAHGADIGLVGRVGLRLFIGLGLRLQRLQKARITPGAAFLDRRPAIVQRQLGSKIQAVGRGLDADSIHGAFLVSVGKFATEPSLRAAGGSAVQIAVGGHGGPGPVPRRGDHLPQGGVPYVTRGKNAGDGRAHALVRDDPAAFLRLQQTLFQKFRMGKRADEDEDPADGDAALFTALDVPDPNLFDDITALDGFEHALHNRNDPGIGQCPLHSEAVGPEGVAPVDEIDPGSETGKIHGLLHGGIAATDDGDFQPFKKSGIAYGTIGYAKTGILALTGAPLPAKTRTAGDDDGPGRDPAAVLEFDDLVIAATGQLLHGTGHEPGRKAQGMCPERLGKGSPGGFGQTGIVLDPAGRQDLPTGAPLFQDEGLDTRASGVDGGRKTGRTCTYDDKLMSFHESLIGLLAVPGRTEEMWYPARPWGGGGAWRGQPRAVITTGR